jgi:hypothetical protein
MVLLRPTPLFWLARRHPPAYGGGVMATRFKRTNKPNLDFAVDYGNYYGRVKLHGSFSREIATARSILGKRVTKANDGAPSPDWRTQKHPTLDLTSLVGKFVLCQHFILLEAGKIVAN